MKYLKSKDGRLVLVCNRGAYGPKVYPQPENHKYGNVLPLFPSPFDIENVIDLFPLYVSSEL